MLLGFTGEAGEAAAMAGAAGACSAAGAELWPGRAEGDAGSIPITSQVRAIPLTLM